MASGIPRRIATFIDCSSSVPMTSLDVAASGRLSTISWMKDVYVFDDEFVCINVGPNTIGCSRVSRRRTDKSLKTVGVT